MTMKNVMMAAAALAAVSTVAHAGTFMDFSQTSNWEGWYAGANVGYASGETDWQFVNPPANSADHDISNVIGGVQGGYNFQRGNWVFGPEVGANFGTIDGEARCPNPAFGCRTEMKNLGTVALRGGYAVGPLLPYLTVGAASAEVKAIPTNNNSTFVVDDRSRTKGFLYGVGIEGDICPNWSVKAEWNRIDFKKQDMTIGVLAEPITINQEVDIVKVGANYRF